MRVADRDVEAADAMLIDPRHTRPGNVRGHDRQSIGHGLEQNDAECFGPVQGRQAVDGCAGEKRMQGRVAQPACETDPFGESASVDFRLQ